MSQFTLDIDAWVKKIQGDLDTVVRKVSIDLFSRIVMRSPVGNPELWAANAEAVTANNVALQANALMRNDRVNVTEAGHLRRGLKRCTQKLSVGKGYVGGRFKGNWQITVGSPPSDEIDRIDKNGGLTIAVESAKLDNFTAGLPIFITNKLPYGQRLEYEGWSKQAPAGMVRISIAEFQNIVDEAVASLTK